MKGSQTPSTVGDGATGAIVRRKTASKQPEILTLTAAIGLKRMGYALLAVCAVGVGVYVAAGYLTIVNGSSTDDQLVSAESPRAEHVEVHEMIMNGAVMQMRPMSALPVAAHDQATLSPGGRHLMFTGVKQPFTPGEQIPVDLTFAHAGKIHVTLDVRAPS